jgi:hypothetical protein
MRWRARGVRQAHTRLEFQPIPADDPRVQGADRPGEVFWEPDLGVIDWLGSEGYLATIRKNDRGQAIAGAARILGLTSQRLLCFFPQRRVAVSAPLSRIRNVEVIRPRLRGLGRDEAILSLDCCIEGGSDWIKSGWGARRNDLESFARKLVELIGEYRAAHDLPAVPAALQTTLMPRYEGTLTGNDDGMVFSGRLVDPTAEETNREISLQLEWAHMAGARWHTDKDGITNLLLDPRADLPPVMGKGAMVSILFFEILSFPKEAEARWIEFLDAKGLPVQRRLV